MLPFSEEKCRRSIWGDRGKVRRERLYEKDRGERETEVRRLNKLIDRQNHGRMDIWIDRPSKTGLISSLCLANISRKLINILELVKLGTSYIVSCLTPPCPNS